MILTRISFNWRSFVMGLPIYKCNNEYPYSDYESQNTLRFSLISLGFPVAHIEHVNPFAVGYFIQSCTNER